MMATKLQFDHDGSVKSREKCARPVSFSALFYAIYIWDIKQEFIRFDFICLPQK